MDTIEQEKVFLQDSNVTVTQSRFVSGGKTYAMRNISSVSLHKIEKSRMGPILIIILGIVFLIAKSYPIGLGLLLLGGLWLFGIKDQFSVRIQSNSGEADGLVSVDKIYVEKVVASINNAIVYRG